jgi:signal transduction histidine kinase
VYERGEGRRRLLKVVEAEGGARNFETTLQRRDRAIYHANLTVMPVTLGGEPFYLAVMQDVTERVQAQMALQDERATLARRVAERTADLESANLELARVSRLKDDFLANMSHELRTPLTVILTLAGMLGREIYGSLTERQDKAIHSIEESGQHLLSLINDILDVSKIGVGKMQLDLATLSAREIARASLELVLPQAEVKELDVSFAAEGELTLRADERRLKQILVNLLSNAVKFTPRRGRIGLEVRDRDGDAVEFTVWDTGIGIPEEHIPDLFEPFVQLDTGPSRQYGGTGLGLSLAYRLARLHGGEMHVESQPGEGSRFSVTLPRAHGAAEVRGRLEDTKA